MAQQTIAVGTSANDGTGDPLRDGWVKTNANFDELYAFMGDSLTPEQTALILAFYNNLDGVKCLTVSLNSTQVNALGTATELIPAPGEGYTLNIISMFARITPDTALNAGGQQINIFHGTTINSPLIGYLAKNFVTSATLYQTKMVPSIGGSLSENLGIYARYSSGNNSTGSATIKFFIVYQKVLTGGTGSGQIDMQFNENHKEVTADEVLDGSFPLYIVTGDAEITISASLRQPITIKNRYSGDIQVTPASGTVDGVASVLVPENASIEVVKFGNNFIVKSGDYTLLP